MQNLRNVLILLFILIHSVAYGQRGVRKTTVEVFDKFEKTFKKFGGSSETFKMSLIRKIDQTAKDTIIGVNIEIEQVKKTDLISSSGLTMTNTFDFAVSSAKVQKIENNKGAILLLKPDFYNVVDFLNETLVLKSQPHPIDQGWQIEIDNRFTIALIYEADARLQYKYYFKLDDGEFEITYEDALELLKKFGKFKDRIESGLKQ